MEEGERGTSGVGEGVRGQKITIAATLGSIIRVAWGVGKGIVVPG